MELETYPVLYIFINKGLQMSSGKIAAQALQAGYGGLRESKEALLDTWWNEGGHHTTLILEARNEKHLENIQDYLKSRDVNSYMMIDEGMTEVDSHTKTALGCELVDKNDPHFRKAFESFKLYRDFISIKMEVER